MERPDPEPVEGPEEDKMDEDEEVPDKEPVVPPPKGRSAAAKATAERRKAKQATVEEEYDRELEHDMWNSMSDEE